MISKQAWVTLAIGLALAGCSPEPTVDASPAQVREVEAWLQVQYPEYKIEVDSAWIKSDESDNQVVCAFFRSLKPEEPHLRGDAELPFGKALYLTVPRQGIHRQWRQDYDQNEGSTAKFAIDLGRREEFDRKWDPICLTAR